jgi:hypothetical protein
VAEDKALHYSSGKLALDQFDWRVLCEDALVLNYGELKYQKNNWRKGTDYSEMLGSTMRHIVAWWLGEDLDPESGLPHLAHARINLMFLRNWQLDVKGVDNRFDVNFGEFPSFFREELAKVIERANEYRQVPA